MKLLKTLAVSAAIGLSVAAAGAVAQTYPVKPVRIITPFPPGSGPDAALRLVSDKLTRAWGQQVIVENRPGGNGFIALQAAKQAAPDGYTLVHGSWFIGSPGHLGAAALEDATGAQMSHIPFKDMNQLYTAVGANDVNWAFGSAASAGSLFRAGKVRFLAVAAPKRVAGYLDVPTFAYEPLPMAPAEMTKLAEAESRKYGEIVKRSKISLD